MARYIDADALKNDGHLCWHNGRGDIYYEVDHAPTADAAEWISIEERYPEKDGSYLICTKKGAVCTAHFYTGKNRFNAYAGKNAAYWMPLPKPPKE